jgi:hypothetical protein
MVLSLIPLPIIPLTILSEIMEQESYRLEVAGQEHRPTAESRRTAGIVRLPDPGRGLACDFMRKSLHSPPA